MSRSSTRRIAIFQAQPLARRAALALRLAAGLASCGGPSTPASAPDAPATLPASAAAQDSVKASLAAPAPDASDTRTPAGADTATAKPAVAKPLGKPRAAQPKASALPVAAAAPAEVPAEAAPVAVPVAPAAPATRTQAGRVVDEEGRSLAGATVMLKGGAKVTSTDANGNYALEVPSGDDTFVFGYGGYSDEVATTHDGQPLNVALAPDPNSKVHGRKRR